MTLVIKDNFDELYPEIKKLLEEAAFIAIDSEFSGLVSHSKLKNSLFDTSSERYLKLKCNIEHITILQFGLAIFQYHRDENRYSAAVYNIYTFPCSFGPVDKRFLCQASSWEFLRNENFDFNQMVYHGVPFLSRVQEDQIRRELFDGTMMTNVERSLSFRDEERLQKECSYVAEWLPKAAMGDILELQVNNTDYCLKYFLHKEIRNRFADAWTFPEINKIVVRKLNADQIKEAREAEGVSVEHQLLDSLLGFTKIVKLLIDLKKPLVGHNLLLDIMIMYNQMYKPLPGSYEAFKKEINLAFPTIYDTKHISYKLKDMFKKQGCWDSNRLDELYVYFHSVKGLQQGLKSPTIDLQDEELNKIKSIESRLHQAGWDAYMSGFCFIRMAHCLALHRMGTECEPRPMSRIEHMSAVKEFCNCLNIIRGNVSYMNIAGPDPPSSRPKMLLMGRIDKKPIDFHFVTSLMASYGSVDVKTLSPSSVIIAVGNKNVARDIVRAFIGHSEYKIVPYSYLMHSSLLNKMLWCGVILSSSFFVGAIITSALSRK